MPRKAAVSANPDGAVALTFDFNKSFQRLRWETFQQFQAQYPNWEGVSLYLYRLWPKIDRALGGIKHNYIDKFVEPVTETQLLREHGSGKYLLTLNDQNRPKQLQKVAETKIDLDDPDYPPRLNLKEVVVGHSDNQSFIEGLKARGLWIGEEAMTGNDSQAVTEMARLVRDVTNKAVQKEEPSQPDPFDQALRMLTVIKEFSPKPPAIQQTDPYEVALKLVTLVQPKQAEPKEDPLEVYARVTETVERIAGRFERGGGGGGWSQVLMKLLDNLPGVIQGIVAMRAMAEPPVPGGAPPGVPSVPVPIQTMENPMAQTGSVELSTLFQAIRPYLFKAMTAGQSGYDFAAGLITFVGQDKYQALAAHGQEGLMGFLKQQADVWPMLAPFEERVREFVEEFLSYGQEPQDEEPGTPEGEVVE